MPTNPIDLLDLADTQWMTLNELLCALTTSLDQPPATVKRIMGAYALETARPARINFTDGSGQILMNMDYTKANDSLATIVSFQLKDNQEQQQAPDSTRLLCNSALVEFTKFALHSWLIRCQLEEVADDVFGKWMRNTYPTLKMHNLVVTGSVDEAPKVQANLNEGSLTLNRDELVELTGKIRGYAQHTVLQAMRIPSKIRADGAVIVLRHDLHSSTNKKIKPKTQPNFDALG